MNIEIISTSIQFKNPTIGGTTRAVKEHYYARKIIASVDGEDRLFVFMKDEMQFIVEEADMIAAIKKKIIAEKEQQKEESQ